jgi:DNA polymerase-1
MIKIENFLRKENLKSKMVMQVHDELVFDVFSGEEDIIATQTKHIMESILTDKPIILRADVGI